MTTPFDFGQKVAIIAGGTGGLGTVLCSERSQGLRCCLHLAYSYF